MPCQAGYVSLIIFPRINWNSYLFLNTLPCRGLNLGPPEYQSNVVPTELSYSDWIYYSVKNTFCFPHKILSKKYIFSKFMFAKFLAVKLPYFQLNISFPD